MWCLVALLVVFCGLTSIKLSYNSKSGRIDKKFSGVEKIGEQGIVKSAVITNRKTGTAPFDAVEGRGNDVGPDDNVVRSFDKISWTVETTMQVKEGQTATSIKGGDLNVEVTLPESCANVVSWDIDSMAWTEGTASVSENGRVFSAKYHMNDQEVTVPGKQNIEIVLEILGVPNNIDITPEFKFWIEGNEDSGAEKNIPGLGLLPLETTFTKDKTRTQVDRLLDDIDGFFSPLSACRVKGYEIHHGKTSLLLSDGRKLPAPPVCTSGNVLGTYIHGFFDSDQIFDKIIRLLCDRKGLPLPEYKSYQSEREEAYDRLADLVRKSLDMDSVYKIVFGQKV